MARAPRRPRAAGRVRQRQQREDAAAARPARDARRHTCPSTSRASTSLASARSLAARLSRPRDPARVRGLHRADHRCRACRRRAAPSTSRARRSGTSRRRGRDRASSPAWRGSWARAARFLVGVDLKKDPRVLERAYDDAAGVTAAFNLNLLARLNRELDADFDLRRFPHRARWNERRGPHRDAPRQRRVDAGACTSTASSVPLRRAASTIHTEHSYKYTLDELRARSRAAPASPCAASGPTPRSASACSISRCVARERRSRGRSRSRSGSASRRRGSRSRR